MCIWPSWLATCEHVFLVEWRHARMLMEEIRFTSYGWSGTYLIVLQVFVHPIVVHDAVFGKQHPAGIFNPIDPDFRIPPWFRWGGILASYWPKRKRISGSILVHNWVFWGWEPAGIYKKVWEIHGLDSKFGCFGSTDWGGEYDTAVNCRCSESEAQKNHIMYPISFVSRSFKNQLIDVPMSEVNHVSDYIG